MLQPAFARLIAATSPEGPAPTISIRLLIHHHALCVLPIHPLIQSFFSPRRYFSGSFSNLSLQPLPQKLYALPLYSVFSTAFSSLIVILQTGSIAISLPPVLNLLNKHRHHALPSAPSIMRI